MNKKVAPEWRHILQLNFMFNRTDNLCVIVRWPCMRLLKIKLTGIYNMLVSARIHSHPIVTTAVPINCRAEISSSSKDC